MNKSQFTELFITELNTECEKLFPKAQAEVELAEVRKKALIQKTQDKMLKKYKVPKEVKVEFSYNHRMRLELETGVSMDIYPCSIAHTGLSDIDEELSILRGAMRRVQPCDKYERTMEAKQWVGVMVSSVKDLSAKEAKTRAKAMVVEYLTPVKQCEV